MNPRRRLALALVLAACVAGLEFYGGARAHSLALLTDAAHVCMDVFALAIALFAAVASLRRADARRTFGYGRVEMLGALANGALLIAAVIVIVYEAAVRFAHPELPHGAMMSVVAAIALVVNGGVAFLLLRDGKRDLNVRAVLFHIGGDALGSIAVIAGGLAILATRAAWIDPLLSLFVACVILAGVWRVLRDATDVLLEGVPRDLRIPDVAAGMRATPGVVAVHDLHVWSIGSGARALSAHVQIDDRRLSEASVILHALTNGLSDRFGIAHATLQLECENCDPAAGIVCVQTPPREP